MHRRAFTIIEILVVVSLLVLVILIGVIQFSRARITAHEEMALLNLRTVFKACQAFLTVNQQYPPNLTILGPAASTPPYLDDSLAQDPAIRQGYQFTYVRLDAHHFTLNVDPVQYGATGIRHFLTNETGTVYYTTLNQPATTSDPTIP